MEYNPLLQGLDRLLDLDGEVLVLTGEGHWVKIEAKLVAESPMRPHGIKYSLSFHDPGNRRILGYDNGHGLPQRYQPADHRHRASQDVAVPYDFEDAEQLLVDFFRDVDDWLDRNER